MHNMCPSLIKYQKIQVKLFYLIVQVITMFRWPKIHHGLALVQEYTESRPSKPGEWDEEAKRVSVVFQSEVKERGCKEHLDLLVKSITPTKRKP